LKITNLIKEEEMCLFVLIVVYVLFLTVLVAFLLLAKEVFKRMRLDKEFAERSEQMIPWHYPGAGRARMSAGKKIRPGMYNILIASYEAKPFVAKVGFKMKIPMEGGYGLNFFGLVRSDRNGKAVFRTYLGKGSCTFLFQLNRPVMEATTGSFLIDLADDQEARPKTVFPPHYLQRLGIGK